MNIIYILLAYNHPEQLKRLIKRLNTDIAKFYIHIDKKSDITLFKKLIPEKDNIFYVDDKNRIDCRWGDLTLVTAVLEACKMIISDNTDGYVVLLSGQDYPLRSNMYINQFLTSHIGEDFLDIYSVPDFKKKSEHGGKERFLNYTFDCYNPRDNRMKAKIRPLSFNLKTIVGFFRLGLYRREIVPKAIKLWFKPKHYPQCLAQVFNEFWFVLQVSTIRYILLFLDSHPDVIEYYKWTHIPDETMFGSILCADNQHKDMLRPKCHLIDWDENYKGSPKIFTSKDIPWIKEQLDKHDNLLFARKFNENDSILDFLDKGI